MNALVVGDCVVRCRFPAPLDYEVRGDIKRFPIYSLQDLEDLRCWLISGVSEELKRELPKMFTVDKMFSKLVQAFESYEKEGIFFTVTFYGYDVTVSVLKM